MWIFYGSVLQGVREYGSRAEVSRVLIDAIEDCGYRVFSKHVAGRNPEEVIKLLTESHGQIPFPRRTQEWRAYVRKQGIKALESLETIGAVFEVSEPSIGTGVEIAHAYLRPRLGLPEIPILCLYQKDYQPSDLSLMVKGILHDELPNVEVYEYSDLGDAKTLLKDFLKNKVSVGAAAPANRT